MNEPSLVVDASVALKWLIPEEDDAKALTIRHFYQEGRLRLIAPLLVLSEVGNALWKLVHRKSLATADAEKLYARFLRDAPVVVESQGLAAAAFDLALRHDRPIYDCMYLALALERGCDLVTADARFCHAMSTRYSCVKLLADYVQGA